MSDHSDKHTIVLLGNPNTGKSSLFSALTGTRQKIANFPGVTVEAKVGNYQLDDANFEVIDLPGTYSLAAKSPDERVAIDALLGRTEALAKPDGLVVVLDASSLDRNLYLATQILEFGLPTVIVLTMVDVAEKRGIKIDRTKLSELLEVPVVEVNSPEGTGLDDLKSTLHKALHHPGKPLKLNYPEQLEKGVNELFENLCDLSVKAGNKPAWPDALRLLIDGSGPYFDQCEELGGDDFIEKFNAIRESAADGKSLAMLEAQTRYGQIGLWTREVKESSKTRKKTRTDKVDAVLTHKIWGSLIFVLVMGVIFQSIYEWSGPMMDAIDGAFGSLGDWVGAGMADGMLKSLIVNGLIAGVGGVLIFLPQILILFLFIAVLEDLGYMSRAAFLMDRIMARFGLTGRSFIPLLSSFACSIPGIMGARVIEDRNTRLTTIFLAPFMSCSARLPVYVIFIGAFVPDDTILGFISLQALTLFAMYWVGVLAAIPTAIVLKKGILKSKVTPFLLEMPSYKRPRVKAIVRVLWDRGSSFVKRAGTIILAASIVVWALAYFPHSDDIESKYDAQIADVESRYSKLVIGFDPESEEESELSKFKDIDDAHDETVAGLEEEFADDEDALETALAAANSDRLNAMKKASGGSFEYLNEYANWKKLEDRLGEVENNRAGAHIENSYLGAMGKGIEPAVEPLGWDWRIGMAAIASFPAREVIVASLGTIFNLGEDEDAESTTLRDTLKRAKRTDGTPLFSLAVALSIMVFFALCAQCAATLATMRRETNSWKWPIASFVYMTGLAYVCALITYQVTLALG